MLKTSLESNHKFRVILQRLNFSTSFSTNAVSICHSAGLTSVTRIEQSTRYLVHFSSNIRCSDDTVVQVMCASLSSVLS